MPVPRRVRIRIILIILSRITEFASHKITKFRFTQAWQQMFTVQTSTYNESELSDAQIAACNALQAAWATGDPREIEIALAQTSSLMPDVQDNNLYELEFVAPSDLGQDPTVVCLCEGDLSSGQISAANDAAGGLA